MNHSPPSGCSGHRFARRRSRFAVLALAIVIASLTPGHTRASISGYYVLDAFGGVHAGGGAAALLPATPYFGFPIARDLELWFECSWPTCWLAGYYVLDGFGGLHTAGTAPPVSPPLPYFASDVAEDFEYTTWGESYVLDAFGRVHYSSVRGEVPPPDHEWWKGPTSESARGGWIRFTLFGGQITSLSYRVTPADQTCAKALFLTDSQIPVQPDGSFSVTIDDLHDDTVTIDGMLTTLSSASGTAEYVLVGGYPDPPYCTVSGSETWTATAIGGPTPNFGFDIARDLEIVRYLRPDRVFYYVLDRLGGVHAGGGETPVFAPATPYFGFDIARDLALHALYDLDGYWVLDGFGGVHTAGAAPVITPETPYFGFDIARKLGFDIDCSGTCRVSGIIVLDGLGGLHAGGSAVVPTPATPYFGFDAAVDLEVFR